MCRVFAVGIYNIMKIDNFYKHCFYIYVHQGFLHTTWIMAVGIHTPKSQLITPIALRFYLKVEERYVEIQMSKHGYLNRRNLLLRLLTSKYS